MMVHFGTLAGLAKRDLSEFLEKYGGNKVLVWDDILMKSLDLIVDNNFLKEHQVVRMFSLNKGRLPDTNNVHVDSIVFITRPEVQNMDKISDNVKGEEMRSTSSTSLDFHVLFVPGSSFLCEMRLKDRGVYGSFTFLDEMSLYWFPMDMDVISMEKDEIFCNFHMNMDPTCLFDVAKAMITLQAVYGFIPHIYGKGKAAKQLCDYMIRVRKEMMMEEPMLANQAQFDALVIIDRQVDLISPLMTQLTYEGLIDEAYGIKHNKVKLPASGFKGGTSEDTSKQFLLSSTEELYAELRDKNFNAVGPILNRKIKATEAQEEERHGAKTVRELRLFVDKMPQIEAMKVSLSKHISIATLIKEYTDSDTFLEFLRVEQDLVNNLDLHKPIEFVEDSCCLELNLARILRLMCLQSVISFGLKPKVVESYRKLVLQAYGHHHLLSLMNLEKAGLLTKQQTGGGNSASYAVLRKRLNLTQSDEDEQNPTDISYVHCVYSPLSVRLVQNCAHPGWKSVRDVLDMLPGPTFEETQKQDPNVQMNSGSRWGEKRANHGLKKTLVLFVGGCTYAEISALRFLSQQEDATTEYMVATTCIMNGDSFIKSLLDPLEDPLSFEVRR